MIEQTRSILSNRRFLGRWLTVLLFSVLSVAGIAFSVYLMFIANSFGLYLLAAAFTCLSVIAGFFNLYASVLYYRSYLYDGYLARIKSTLKPIRRFPTVALAVPIYNEEADMVDRNVASLLTMRYPKDKIKVYMLDDSTDQSIRKKMVAIAKKYHVQYLHREDRKGFKAGAVNNMLKHSKEEYVAIFDSDERLVNPNFLLDTIPYFDLGNVSYVQTIKKYDKGTFFSGAVDIFDAFFFNFIQPARALNNTAIFAGSCGVISRKALDEIGGLPEYIIEDTFFSFESDSHNYQSLYVPEVYALGRPVKTFTELAKQQWRYNYGDTQFISYFIKKKGFTKRTPLSNMDYITHGFGLNYLSVILILFTLVSIGIVFSAVPLAHINLATFFTQNTLSIDLECLGFFAFTLSLLTPVLLTKVYFGSLSKGFMVFLLNYALAFVRAKAAIATLFNKNPGFHWNRLKVNNGQRGLLFAVSNTKTEIVFASTMFVLSFLALSQSDLSGCIWLIWYGILYLLATIFLHKYG